MVLTDADKESLRAILRRDDVRIDGKIHVPTVESLSGLSYGCIYNFIKNDPYWAAQTSEAKPDAHLSKEADLVDGEPPDPSLGITISDTQFKEYQAMIRQARKMMAGDWQALGMSEEAGKRMQHYGTLGAAPTGQILRVTTGQLISNLELLDRIIKADCERILNDNLPEEKMKNGDPRDPEEVEREWRQTVFNGMKLQLDMFSHVHKVQALMARVMRDLHLMNGGAPPPAKGTFEMPTGAVSERPS